MDKIRPLRNARDNKTPSWNTRRRLSNGNISSKTINNDKFCGFILPVQVKINSEFHLIVKLGAYILVHTLNEFLNIKLLIFIFR